MCNLYSCESESYNKYTQMRTKHVFTSLIFKTRNFEVSDVKY